MRTATGAGWGCECKVGQRDRAHVRLQANGGWGVSTRRMRMPRTGRTDACVAVVEDGMAVVPFNRGDSLAGVPLNGKGKVSVDHWSWRDDQRGTDAVTPVLHEGKVYVLKDGGPQRGRVTCMDAKTGKHLWESQLPKGPQVYYASPVLAGDRFYAVREDGMVFSGTIGAEGLVDIKSHALEEGVIASPIVANGRLLVRTDNHLFCFGEK